MQLTFAFRQSSGRVPESSDFWKTIVNDGAMTSAQFLRIKFGIESGPHAFVGFIFFSNLRTPGVCTVMSPIIFCCSLDWWSVLLTLLLGVKTDWNCRNSILALSFVSLQRIWLLYSGATPMLSVLLFLIPVRPLLFLLHYYPQQK